MLAGFSPHDADLICGPESDLSALALSAHSSLHCLTWADTHSQGLHVRVDMTCVPTIDVFQVSLRSAHLALIWRLGSQLFLEVLDRGQP